MELFYCHVLFIISVVITLNTVNGQSSLSYRIPQPTAAVLTPRGFRISIPGMQSKRIETNQIQTTHQFRSWYELLVKLTKKNNSKTIFKLWDFS